MGLKFKLLVTKMCYFQDVLPVEVFGNSLVLFFFSLFFLSLHITPPSPLRLTGIPHKPSLPLLHPAPPR